MGELAAVYNKAGYAVQKAEQVSGVVISSEQNMYGRKETGILFIQQKQVSFNVKKEKVLLMRVSVIWNSIMHSGLI